MRNSLFALSLLPALVTFDSARAADPVPYPEGYRDWHHVKSMVIQDGHPLFSDFGGIHHLYANRIALEGYKSGRFPDGAIIVFDLLTVDVTGDGAIIEGARKVVGVMQKDAQRWATTGGWGFEGFKGDTRERGLGSGDQKTCFACHAGLPESDFVFSSTRP